ncbi:MAG: restriction endonuclease subunit S [Clostridia bacterium]|nr:restriction endonuclease subunit S [Clostridia bacterium]MDD4048855.1 restriction endonuclease subunit S [Clostridia bacterium]
MKSRYSKVPMKSLTEQIRGVTYKESDLSVALDSDHKPVLRANNIVDGKIEFDDLVFVSNKNIKGNQLVREGDIIIAASSGSKNIVGKAAQFLRDYEVSFGAFCKIIRPNSGVNHKYLGYYFQSSYYRYIISNLSNGANINNIRNEHINNLRVPLPPLQTQKEIVEVLDKAQELIDLRKKQIELLDNLIQSVFYDMFGDPVTNPMGWEVKRIGDLSELVTGNTPSRKIDEYYGDYIDWIKSGNINTSDVYITSAKERLSKSGADVGRVVDEKTILMTCIAGSLDCIGNVAITDKRVAFNQQINAIIPLNSDVYFMYVLMLVSKKYIQKASTNSMKGMLSKGKLSELTFIVPNKDLQDVFGEIFFKYYKQKQLMQQSLTEMENNFNSLMQRAFKGELFLDEEVS